MKPYYFDLNNLLKGIGNLFELIQKMDCQEEGEFTKKGVINWPGREHGIRSSYGFTIKVGADKLKKEDPKETYSPEVTREPLVDIFDEEKYILVIAELPGAIEKDISIKIKDNLLVLNYPKIKYQKEITLSTPVNEDIQTSWKNGILEIILTKSKEGDRN